MANDTKSNTQTSGVQQLIDRLREEGVASGQSEGERLLAEARVKAMEILDHAKVEANKVLEKAHAEAKSIEEDGKAALNLACRDVVLKVREACYEEFKNRLNRLVRHKLEDPKLLEQMILELAADVRPKEQGKEIRLLLPQSQVSEQDLQREVANPQPGSLAAFVLGLTADILREGMSFAVSQDDHSGIKLQIVEDDVQLELSDQTITTVLLEYLVPRYRALLKKDH